MPDVLVDTSVWLDAHRGHLRIDALVPAANVAICPAIAQELLQGAQDPAEYQLVWETILGAVMVDDPTPLAVFEEAAHIYRRCRDSGYLIASAHDCLIAATAILHDMPLLHRDADFKRIAKVTQLQQLPGL